MSNRRLVLPGTMEAIGGNTGGGGGSGALTPIDMTSLTPYATEDVPGVVTGSHFSGLINAGGPEGFIGPTLSSNYFYALPETIDVANNIVIPYVDMSAEVPEGVELHIGLITSASPSPTSWGSAGTFQLLGINHAAGSVYTGRIVASTAPTGSEAVITGSPSGVQGGYLSAVRRPTVDGTAMLAAANAFYDGNGELIGSRGVITYATGFAQVNPNPGIVSIVVRTAAIGASTPISISKADLYLFQVPKP